MKKIIISTFAILAVGSSVTWARSEVNSSPMVKYFEDQWALESKKLSSDQKTKEAGFLAQNEYVKRGLQEFHRRYLQTQEKNCLASQITVKGFKAPVVFPYSEGPKKLTEAGLGIGRYEFKVDPTNPKLLQVFKHEGSKGQEKLTDVTAIFRKGQLLINLDDSTSAKKKSEPLVVRPGRISGTASIEIYNSQADYIAGNDSSNSSANQTIQIFADNFKIEDKDKKTSMNYIVRDSILADDSKSFSKMKTALAADSFAGKKPNLNFDDKKFQDFAKTAGLLPLNPRPNHEVTLKTGNKLTEVCGLKADTDAGQKSGPSSSSEGSAH